VLFFLGAALLLLILAGVNAANLLIVRGLERDGELSLRRALGAARGRIALGLVAESVSLAMLGGVVGLAIAAAGVAAFRRFGPQGLPRMSEVALNPRIVVAGVILSTAVGIFVGVIPAIRSSGADLLSNLRTSLTAMSPRGTRLRTSLAATQLALALVLGIGASLLFRSFVQLRTERLGFAPNGLVAFTVAFKNARWWETWDEVTAALERLPGVTAVAGASNLPFETAGMLLRVSPVERTENAVASIAGYAVSPSFFRTANIPILVGRSFDSSDRPDARRVAIVNERFARMTYRDDNPVGRLLRVRGDDGDPDTELEIVGVAGDVVQARIEDGMLPAVYLPYTQAPAPMGVLVASRRDPASLTPEIRRALVDVGLWSAPVLGMSSMEERIGKSLSAPRFQLLLIGMFAGVAVLLAGIGLYGTLAFAVRSRTRELGIRMAMGATQRQIFDLVLAQGLRVLAVGLGVGTVAAVGLTRLLRGFLYRVSPIDPLAFLGAVVVLATVVLVAALRPAGRAARVDPMASMRAGN
jgi:predicted permease